jgi:ubiquinol-cytochrome c reductase iron-sulfur subunit
VADTDSVTTAVERVEGREVALGAGVVAPDRIENPGFPPERPRVTDVDPAKDRQQERRVVALFYVSAIASILAVAAYIVTPLNEDDLGSVRLNNLLLGLCIAVSLLAIGVGTVHWAKALMKGHDLVEGRHETRGSDSTRAKAIEVFKLGNEESGFSRRVLLRNSLIASALALIPIPVVLFRDLAPAALPADVLRHTMWAEGMRLTRDPDGALIRAADVTIGSVFHVIPDGLADLSIEEHRLEEKAKASVLLMRLEPSELNAAAGREDWAYEGIIAYSKICTHVGCPVALYEQHTHHLLCPCHQSQFDVANGAAVIFGPAARPLPQLPITVDDEGYLVARSDFTEPVGPSFWERSLS